jgi:hypothetical protein
MTSQNAGLLAIGTVLKVQAPRRRAPFEALEIDGEVLKPCVTKRLVEGVRRPPRTGTSFPEPGVVLLADDFDGHVIDVLVD